MAMPKSPDLTGSDARRLMHYTQRMNDDSLDVAQRKTARKKRLQLMLSLYRAGWKLPPIAAAAGNTLSVAREQIIVLPPTIKSVEVTNTKGEKVIPEPLAKEFEYGDLTDVEVRHLQAIAPVANRFNFSHSEITPEYKASHLLDVVLAFLYDKDRRPTDMARAIESSNSLVRSRIRRAKSGPVRVPGNYVVPEVIAADFERITKEIDAALPASQKSKAKGEPVTV